VGRVGRRRAQAREKRRPTAWLFRGPRKKERKRETGRGEKGFGIFLFKFFSNSFFKLFKLHSHNKTMHSNHDAQALIISNIIEMIFKYFKGQFIY
jgi:hypothetical protein